MRHCRVFAVFLLTFLPFKRSNTFAVQVYLALMQLLLSPGEIASECSLFPAMVTSSVHISLNRDWG